MSSSPALTPEPVRTVRIARRSPLAAFAAGAGVGVLGGMISATVLAIFFVPAFFVFVLKTLRTKRPSDEVDAKNVVQGEEVLDREELPGTAVAARAQFSRQACRRRPDAVRSPAGGAPTR